MKKNNSFLKSISLVLVNAFVLEQVAFAAPELKPLAWDLSPQKPRIQLSLPSSVALVEDAYTGDAKSKTIYLIQDAHTNLSGQINLARTLEQLFSQDKSLKCIFSEAATGDNSLGILDENSLSADQKNQTYASFLKKGLLSGHEYFNLTHAKDSVLLGVEDLSLYQKALEDYKAVVLQRRKFMDYLAKIDNTLTSLKPRILNPSLIGYF
ncbi:MAG: hypothetical protein WCG06_01740, partial [Candidatus Omnitrophota bacterium]